MTSWLGWLHMVGLAMGAVTCIVMVFSIVMRRARWPIESRRSSSPMWEKLF